MTWIECFIGQLELGYNPIGPEGAKSLSEVLKYHGKIETLKLGWCQVICDSPCTPNLTSFLHKEDL